jgi:hypothetical protein
MPSLDSLYSTASSLGQKISALNIADSVNAGVSNFSAAVQMAASKLPSLSIVSKFESKDLPKAITAKDTTTPSEVIQNKSTFAGALTFPSEMKYFTKFSFYEFNKKDVTSAVKDLPTQTFILPMPNNLQESFGVEYETPSLGPIAGAAANAVISALRSNNPGASAAGIVGDLLTTPTIAIAGAAASLNALKKMSPEAGAIGGMAFGVAPNPNMAVLFSNIGLRTHSFSYKFAPTSAKELATLKTIISQLKTRMLPGMADEGSMLFTFPDVCDIEFGPEKNKPYKIKRCVMDSLSVNYTPMGSPAFFKTGDPVMVEINMSFKEMSPFTRVDMKDDKNSQASRDQQTSASKPGESRVQ